MQIRHHKFWDLSRPVAHDGPGWAEHDPPVIRRNHRREVEGFNAETIGPDQLGSRLDELREGDFAAAVPSSPPSRSCSKDAAAHRPRGRLGDRGVS